MTRNEGLRGLYRGLSANLIGVTPEKAIKLAVNDSARSYFAAREGVSPQHVSYQAGILSGGLAGLCQVAATNPMEIVKIQMQLAKSSEPPHRTSIFTVVRRLGIKGLYRGTLATLCRDVPFSMIFFQSFASCKAFLSKGDSTKAILPVLLSGIIAGSIAAYLVTPMDGNGSLHQASD